MEIHIQHYKAATVMSYVIIVCFTISPPQQKYIQTSNWMLNVIKKKNVVNV